MFQRDGMGTLKLHPLRSTLLKWAIWGGVQGVIKPLEHTSGFTEAAGSATGTVDSHGRAENGKWLRWRDTKINDIHDFTGYCYFHDKTELGGCFLHSVLLALSLGPD